MYVTYVIGDVILRHQRRHDIDYFHKTLIIRRIIEVFSCFTANTDSHFTYFTCVSFSGNR